MQKRLIINADDMGLTETVNRGIIEAHQKGILTSTTLMVNMPGFNDAVRRLREHPGVGVGLHLNLVRGRPLTSAAAKSSLVDKRGYFHGSVAVLFRTLLVKRSARSALVDEIRAQMEKALSFGITISHVDGEKHAHLFPAVLAALNPLMREYGVKKMRLCLLGGPGFIPRLLPRRTSMFPDALFVHFLSMKAKILCSRWNVRSPDYFFGFSGRRGIERDYLERIVEAIPEGTSELMCHPGYVDEGLEKLSDEVGGYYINRYREGELSLLKDKKISRMMMSKNIELIDYGKI